MKTSRIALWVGGILCLVWLILPTLVVIPMSLSDKASFLFPPTGLSLRWYANLFQDRVWLSALRQTVLIAFLASMLAAAVGVPAAIAIHRYAPADIKVAFRAILVAPLLVPEVILAIGIYSMFLQMGLVGSLLGFVVSHAAIGVPMIIIAVTASLAALDSNLELAGASLGAGAISTFRWVTLPLIMPGVASGMLFAFILSMDNVLISLLLKTPTMNTLPVQMWSSMTRDTDPTIAAAATVILIGTLLVLTTGLYWIGRRARRTTM